MCLSNVGKVGVYAANCMEWMVIIQAVNRMSAVLGNLLPRYFRKGFQDIYWCKVSNQKDLPDAKPRACTKLALSIHSPSLAVILMNSPPSILYWCCRVLYFWFCYDFKHFVGHVRIQRKLVLSWTSAVSIPQRPCQWKLIHKVLAILCLHVPLANCHL